MKNYKANKCDCGAVTVSSTENSKMNWSMSEKDFNKNFPDLSADNENYYNCDYCTNNWGIDLCNCGSGEKYDVCCGIPSQEIGKIKEVSLWKWN